MRFRAGLFFFFLLLSQSALAEEDFLQNAEKAAAKGDKKNADFWAARYLGAGGDRDKMGDFLKLRKLVPKGFIPSDWDAEAVEWFEKSPDAHWGVGKEKIREQHRSFEIVESAEENSYTVKIVAYPELELWHVLKQGVISRPLIIAMAGHADRPMIFFTRLYKGRPPVRFTPHFLKTQRRSLHAVWKPEFHDADGDGTPEVWIRFNLGWGNGFSQVLDIYKIRDETDLVLWKHFQGNEEGIARRLPDGRVQVGWAIGSQGTVSRMQYDRHFLQTWEYKEGDFRKISEEDVPFVLKIPDWGAFYLSG